ncbi:hypothetical protein J1P26_07425 [Neobacillus sp. MM2021_6]|uniref:hypothetical protein n=1 Tax=Bacillaceae TaxID=186817 RepID=UPI001409010D|nr:MULTISPECIES: hypothetical protein [Bacillaceae]MBO0959563.1 hypothetical protein [Neobacillus sp. MM2021_6]NHC17139.1 hypothetical protein [Bacillus sp. MM2020_4]
MFYYTVKTIGSGTESDPFRPDLPEGTAFVGQEKDGEYLVAVINELPEQAGRKKQLPRQALEATAKAKGLTYDDVMKWNVGGSG